MAEYLLIDNDKLRLMCLAPTLLQAEYLAEIYCRATDYSIESPAERKFLAKYTDMELRMFYYHLTGKMLPSKAEYGNILPLVYDAMMENLPELNETPVEMLREILGRDLQTDPTPVVPPPDNSTSNPQKAASAPKRTTGGGSGGGKPKGGTTARVWEIADAVMESIGSEDIKALRSSIITKCEEEGINSSTAGTQYSKWKRDRIG